MIYLAQFYGIDVLGYAIMGNHMHVILRNRPEAALNCLSAELSELGSRLMQLLFLVPI